MRPGGHEYLVECSQTNKWAGSGFEGKLLSAALSCVKLSVACEEEEEKEVDGLWRCGAGQDYVPRITLPVFTFELQGGMSGLLKWCSVVCVLSTGRAHKLLVFSSSSSSSGRATGLRLSSSGGVGSSEEGQAEEE
ncbi:unnamed protein product [Taenia asiatica]|uniref:Sushi domain-containing protein n=1 Tax=Taenia asiatica TaxID=60517 RepID=A0A0R3WFI8_TAEAS|nr:unnamed protein product [Taenia asiatica]